MSTFGLVIDVAVTGTKKTIVVRSPIQVRGSIKREGEWEGEGRKRGRVGGRREREMREDGWVGVVGDDIGGREIQ